MMNYNDEIIAYTKLCNNYLPNFASLNFLQKKKTLKRIFQMINLFELLKDYDVSSNKNLCKLSEMCLNTLFDFLIAIPVGNNLFISACTRQFAEELLEIVYSEYCNKNIKFKNLISLNYRKLWQDGIQQSSKYKNLSQNDNKHPRIVRERSKLNNVNDIFRKDSDELHFKNKDLDIANYLEQMIVKNTEFNNNCESLVSKINKLHLFCIDILPIIVHLDINKLTMNQKSEYINLINNLN